MPTNNEISTITGRMKVIITVGVKSLYALLNAGNKYKNMYSDIISSGVPNFVKGRLYSREEVFAKVLSSVKDFFPEILEFDW